MSDFKKLYKSRNRNLSEISKNSGNQGGYQKDLRFWKPDVDKNTQTYKGVIRFLPGLMGEENSPVISFKRYFIRTPKGVFVTAAPENANLKSFPAETASALWKKYSETGDMKYKTAFVNRVASETFITNILVVKDPVHPENNGKVFLFEMGRQLKTMLFHKMGIYSDKEKEVIEKQKKMSMAIDDEDEDVVEEEVVDVTDIYEGADFVLNIYSTTGEALNRTYKDSKWRKPSSISDDEDEIEAIFNQQYSLKEFHDPNNEALYGESYEDMKKRYIDMTGDYYDFFPENYDDDGESKVTRSYNEQKNRKSPMTESDDLDDDEDLPWEEEKSKKAKSSKSTNSKSKSAPVVEDDEDDEDDDVFDTPPSKSKQGSNDDDFDDLDDLDELLN